MPLADVAHIGIGAAMNIGTMELEKLKIKRVKI